MSVRFEHRRPLAIPGPLALEAMLAILKGVARQEPPYERTALSLGLESVRIPAGEIAVPVAVGAREQPQRYECELIISAATGSTFFPTFTGSMSVSPLRDSGSDLWMQGSYTVPMGALGEVVDATVLRGAAAGSLDRFLAWMADEIANRVRADQRADLGR